MWDSILPMPRKKSIQLRILTTEERKTRNGAILAALRNGKTYQEIANEFKLGISLVGRVARNNDLGRGVGRRSSLSSEQQKEVEILLQSGKRYKDIAHQMGTTIATITRVAHNYKIYRGPGNRHGTRYSHLSDAIVQLRAQGYSLRAIAAELKISHQNVSYHLKMSSKYKS